MTKFKHFETESGKTIMTAEFDGYDIAERLLEGLMFQITVQPDGTLKASVKPSDEGYFSQFNTAKFLKEAEDYASECDEFTDPVSGEVCWLVVDGQDNRPKRVGIPIQATTNPFGIFGSTSSNTNSTTQEEEKEPIIGEFKPKRKFLSFVSAVNGAKIRFIRDTALIKGEKLSGVLDGLIFKITICDEGTVNFEEIDTNQTDSAQRQRLLNDIDDMDVTGYAQKFVVSGLEFTDVDGGRCYLEVEHEKPINRFANLLDLFDEEKKAVENATLSDKGLSILDSLFGESDAEVISSEKDAEVFVEEMENPSEPSEKLKNAATSYMEEQFRKMNEEKVNELKSRIEDSEKEARRIKMDISQSEAKLKKLTEDLGVLETRLDSFNVNDESTGCVFFVSEEKKAEDIGLTEENREIADKIADIVGLKKDVLFKMLTQGHYEIRVADKNDFESEVKMTSEIYDKIKSLTSADESKDAKVTMVKPGHFEYRGSLTWHQLVSKMIRKGFEQNPDFDKYCNSNSYESKWTGEDSEEDSEDQSAESVNSPTGSVDFESQDLMTFNEPTHLIVMGTLDHNENSDVQITDDYSSFDAYINGRKMSRRYSYDDGY